MMDDVYEEPVLNRMLKPVSKGFEAIMFVQGTEREVREHIEGEFGRMCAYRAATESEYKAFKSLGGKCCLA